MYFDLLQYFPRYYDGSQEIEALANAENYLFNAFFDEELRKLQDNQFFLTADENTIRQYEKLISIAADPEESLQFRRERIIGNG